MRKIFINPGHCPNIDSGAVSTTYGVTEADIVKEIGEALAERLEDSGYKAKCVQSDNLCGEDGYPYFESVVSQANYWEADYFISIHCNAFNGNAHGTECFYASYAGQRLANNIQNELVEALDTTDRGLKDGKHLIVIKHTDMPAVLVELAFIDNDEDCEKLIYKQEDIVEALYTGIIHTI